MRFSHLIIVLAVFLVLGTISACDGDKAISPPEETLTPEGTTLTGTTDAFQPRAAEAHFHQLEQEAPGFGGFFIDEGGDLVVWLKDYTANRSEKAKAATRDFLRSAARRGLRSRNIRVIAARYSFSELAAWRSLLTKELLGRGLGVKSTDADEVLNRVVVGVSSDKVFPVVRKTAARLGIPPAAVRVMVETDVAADEPSTDPANTPSNPPSNEFYGGLQVVRHMSGSDYAGCTLSFFTRRDSEVFGITNSHCSENVWDGPGDNSFFQTNELDGVGYEAHDRGFYDWCPTWYNVFRYCRNADANLIAPWSTEVTPRQHLIANYINLNPGASNDATYLEVNFENPLPVVYRNVSTVGDVVYKAGAKTGRTRGSITATCKDLELYVVPVWNFPAGIFSCQHEASYGRDKGDSGAPVYAMTPDGADLRGIHWAYYPQFTGMKVVFSPLSGIEDDFGGLEIPTSPPPDPNALSVELIGPTQIDSSATYHWYVDASGGDGPHSYTWYRRTNYQTPTCVYQTDWVQVGTGVEYSSFVSTHEYDFQLRVNVTAGTYADSDFEWVFPAYPPLCPQ